MSDFVFLKAESNKYPSAIHPTSSSRHPDANPSRTTSSPLIEDSAYINLAKFPIPNAPQPQPITHPFFSSSDPKNSDFFQIISIPKDTEQRKALLLALKHFADQKNAQRVNQIVNVLELSLPLMESSETEFLKLYTEMGINLRGSGLSQEKVVLEKAQALAQISLDRNDPLAIQARQALAAWNYFQSMEDIEHIQVQTQNLLVLQKRIEQQNPEPSLSLTRLSLQIDQALLPYYQQEAINAGPASPSNGDKILSRIGRFRKMLEASDQGLMENRLADVTLLAQALGKLRLSGVASDLWESQLSQTTEYIRGFFSDILDQGFASPSTQESIAQLIVQDLTDRVQKAVEQGDAPWLEQLNLEKIGKIVSGSQQAHLLLNFAGNSQKPELLGKRLQAALFFAQIGLEQRVHQALEPLENLPLNPQEQVNHYFSLSQIYQLSGLSAKANNLFDKIIAIQKNNPDPQLVPLALKAYLFRLLNNGQITEAKSFLKKLAPNDETALMDSQLNGAIQAHNLMAGIQVLSGVLSDYLNSRFGENPAKKALLRQSVDSVMAHTLRFITQDKKSDFKTAFKQASQNSSFSTYLMNFADESNEGARLWGLLNAINEPQFSDEKFLNQALELGHTYLVRNYFQGVMQLANFVNQHPSANKDQKTIAGKLLETIPSAAVVNHALFAAQELIAMINVFGNVLNPNIKMDRGFFTRAGITVGSLGIARGVGAGIQAWWISRMKNIVTTPLTFRISTLGVRSVSEAAAFPLTAMGLQTLMSGEVNHWDLKSFPTEFGAMLVMFSLLNASTLSLQWGQVQSQRLLARGNQNLAQARALGDQLQSAQIQVGTRKALHHILHSPMAEWGSRLGALTASSYANEATGLQISELGSDFFARLLNAAVTDAQMVVGGKMIDGMSGGRLGKWDRANQLALNRHFAHSKMINPPTWLQDLFSQGPWPVTETGLILKMAEGPKDPSQSDVIPRGEGAKYLKTKDAADESIEILSQIGEVRPLLPLAQLQVVRDIYIKSGKKPPRSLDEPRAKFVYQYLKRNIRLYRNPAAGVLLISLLRHFPNLTQASSGSISLKILGTDHSISISLPKGVNEGFNLGRSLFGGFRQLNILSKRRIQTVSKIHVKLGRDAEGRLYIQDLNSKNGTFVNEERLSPFSRIILEPGDQLRLGGVDLYIPFDSQ